MVTNRFICLCLLVWVCSSNCQENFFVAKKYYNRQYKCVTNSSFALSWIDNKPDEASLMSTYIPSGQANFFDCDITDDDRTKNYYIRDPWWLEKSTKNLILDRRWEDMKPVTTDYTKYDGGSLTYTEVLRIQQHDFEIGFSIRAKKEAHFFLCDGPHPPEANCYWFMLQASGGNVSAIRKCGSGYIPSKYAKEPSRTELSRINHPKFPPYLSDKYWSHFKLNKKSNYLSLVKTDGYNEKPVLKLTDNENLINARYMVVHSKAVEAFWKIHELEYIYTNQHATTTNLGSSISPVKGVVCISLFVSMCNTCRLKLALSGQNGIIKEQIYRRQSSEWSEIKFLYENVQYSALNLSVTTIGSSYDRFWAIDKTRQCHKTEYRVISSEIESKCQLMSDDNNVLSINEDFHEIDNECPEDSVGDFCVPCTWIFKNCEKIKICSKQQKTKSKCTCSAGFRNYGTCNTECYSGNYGHNCQKRCGKCNDTCNVIDGSCSNCTDNYSGPKCDISPSTTFVNPPEVLGVRFTTATVRMTNFQLVNEIAGDPPMTYSFQIKKADNQNDNWTYNGKALKLYENRPFTITDLEVDQKYFVRCVVDTTRKKYAKFNIPRAEFTTKCQDLAEDNIHVESTNTSVNISINRHSKYTCRIARYKITISSYGEPTLIEMNDVFFDYLTPYKNYTLVFYNNETRITKIFQTSEGVPETVQNLTATALSPSTIELRWHRPGFLYGNLIHYIVEYQHESYLGCNFSSSHPPLKSRLNVPTAYTLVENLIPFSRYLFSVFAVNTKFDGISYTQQQTTLSSEEIQAEETPEITEIVEDKREVTIRLSSVDCDKMRGTLLLYAILSCIEEWCKHQTRVDEYHAPWSEILLNDLMPFTNYRLELHFCRKKDMCQNSKKSRHFRTKPEVPNEVSDLLVYSKSNSTISLRWKPPYPPTGILAEYIVRYRTSYERGWTNRSVDKNSNCKLWPEFQCVTLTNLKVNFTYEMLVYVKNEDPKATGKPSTLIKANTITERSQAPYDFKCTWTAKNDLELHWRHPNRSNGEIRSFKITIIPSRGAKIGKMLPVTEETYKLTYYYKIESKDLQPSTQYTIKILAHNGVDGDEETVIETTPPEVPLLSFEPQITSTNRTITLKIAAAQPQRRRTKDCSAIFLISKQIFELRPETFKNVDLNKFKIVIECRLMYFDYTYSVTIGDNVRNENCKDRTPNRLLSPGTTYNVNIILKNVFKNKTTYSYYSYSVRTMDLITTSESNNSNSFVLFRLLLIVPFAPILFM